MKEYSKRFKSQILQELFSTEIPEDWSLIALTLGLSQQPYQCAGYPVGGSLNLAKNIEREAKRLGVTFRYNSTVDRIVVEDGVAKGVTLRGGEHVDADYVISAADGHTTLFGMLEGKYLSKPYQKAYESYPLFPSSIMVALGLKGDYSGYPHESSPYFKEPITLFDGSSHNRFNLNVYHYDPTLAPKGKTLITVMFNTWEGEQWQQLATDNPKQYEEEKSKLTKEVLARLEKIIGPLEDKVEMVDVSTPHSVIRYTGNWQGSFEGFAPTKATLSKSLPKTLPGLKHFAMIGQWTTPGGGLPTAAKDGLDIAKKLCKEHGKPFTSKLS
jgi:phytoene dehydrogenase-like protein